MWNIYPRFFNLVVCGVVYQVVFRDQFLEITCSVCSRIVGNQINQLFNQGPPNNDQYSTYGTMLSRSVSVLRVLLLPFRTPTSARTSVNLVKGVVAIPTTPAVGPRQYPTTTRICNVCCAQSSRKSQLLSAFFSQLLFQNHHVQTPTRRKTRPCAVAAGCRWYDVRVQTRCKW
jgi:hypothetical protein